MVQALTNSIDKLKLSLNSKESMSEFNQGVDFSKLYDKQFDASFKLMSHTETDVLNKLKQNINEKVEHYRKENEAKKLAKNKFDIDDVKNLRETIKECEGMDSIEESSDILKHLMEIEDLDDVAENLEDLKDVIEDALEDVTESLGEDVLPEVQDAIEKVADVVQNIIQNVSNTDANNETEDDISVDIDSISEDLQIANKNFESALKNVNKSSSDVSSNLVSSENATSKESVESEKALEDIVDEKMLEELNVESIETDASGADSSSGDDIMQNQTPQEQGIKAMIQGDSDFSKTITEVKSLNSTQNVGKQQFSSSDITPNKIIEQITKQMEGLQNNSKVNIVLNPEALGKVSVQLINTKEGLSAQFTVVTQEARNLIMKGLDGLRDTLLSQGISVDNVSVKTSEQTANNTNDDNWTEKEGSRGGNKERNQNQEEKKDKHFEQMLTFVENETR